ncbi:alpha/beta hydrolase [Candidatus Mycobacterium wuenschmannii]|uniref:Alpha/beta hydrolase n=1 Tax=Candidatus Mycobacterium wuenschmannii TaxID=3027808 RepID=A0ABY8VQB3_9MYCO|nr:alpha/beta hydrolase [Candidatus Mycobacterium wuenschmannii]WIM85828.1 alpha/beta hydrolase [Candidatus Mycobacterium wuenschmannii]
MTISLADIDRWNPQAITTVFQAAISRARGTRTASNAIGQTMGFLDWGGDAADAAKAATHRTMLTLDDHAAACEAVGRAAEKAAGEVQGIKDRLAQIRETANHYRLSIDNSTGMVSLPANLSSFSAADQREIRDAQIRVMLAIAQLLSDAQAADDDLAAAIRGADGDLSPDQVNAETSGAPTTMPRVPPKGTEPTDVTKWWHSLTPSQQDLVRAASPDSIRNLEGIPTDIRSALNKPVLQSEILRLQNGWLDRNGVWHTDPAKLADLTSLSQTLATRPDARLIELDTTSNPFKVLAAVGIGDVDNAERVGVTTGGLNTRVSSSVDSMVREAETQRASASKMRTEAGISNPDAVASIAYLGYDAPSNLVGVTHDYMARDAAGPLNSFYKGIAATSNVSDQHITAFGHSYGSLVTSLALQQGAPVSDVVLYGSPGTELTNASQLGVQPGHAYYMIGVNDGVSEIIPEFGAFGRAPQDVPGFTELSVNSGMGPGDNQWHERAYGHSEYARDGDNRQLRMSGYNMAAVLGGLPSTDLVTPPVLPPPTIPSGPGPFGLPIPNPDYHP